MIKVSREQLAFADEQEAQEYFFAKGWTDGLPVILPTPQKVKEMLDYVGLGPDQVIGTIPERNRVITAEKIASNAVMAGCLPNYMPVVIAAMEAILDPSFSVHGLTASTGGAAIMLIVNGPVIRQLNMNTGRNFMGNTTRANATIGRAIMLVMRNAGGTAEFDQTTIGHPGKQGFCVAEAECKEWEPLHVERGFSREESTVTVFAAEGPNQINNHVARTPEDLLISIADRMTTLATFHMQRETPSALVLCPEHQQTLVQYGWDKKKIKQFLYEHAVRKKTDYARYGVGAIAAVKDEPYIHAIPSPNDLIILSGGGPAGRFSAFIPGWGSKSQSTPVTKKINLSGFS